MPNDIQTRVDSGLQVRKEIFAAEIKIAFGINELYKFAKQKNVPHDMQGVGTLKLEQLEIPMNIQQCFPDGLAKGITLHLYNNGFVALPPINYMVEQEIRAFCKVAQGKYSLNENRINEVIEELHKVDKDKISPSSFRDSQFHNNLNITFDQRAQILLADALNKLYEIYKSSNSSNKKNPLSFSDFTKQLVKDCSHSRSNTSMVTFNEKTKTFSYDSGADISAHDRATGQKCANLSLVVDGNYRDNSFSVTSSIVKHASLPSSSVSRFLGDNADILVDTYQHAREVIETMVKMRLHGGAPRNKEMVINWNYLLLTTNAWNIDSQATSYGYAVKAMHLLNQANFKIDGVDVKIRATLFNAGINSWGEWNLLQKADTQRVENRKAYICTTEALNSVKDSINAEDILNEIKISSNEEIIEEELNERFKQDLKNLSKVVPPALDSNLHVPYQEALDLMSAMHIKDAVNPVSSTGNKEASKKNIELNFSSIVSRYHQIKEKIDTLNKISYEEIDEHSKNNLKKQIKENQVALKKTKDCINDFSSAATDTNHLLRSATYKIERQHIQHWQENKKSIMDAIAHIKDGNVMEKLGKALNDGDKNIIDKTTERVLAIGALVYKAYMNDLYYSGKYRSPKNAAVFNGYYAAYQRLTGMMTSTGCKSANDRTYVARLFLATIEGRSLSEVPLPPAYHNDPEKYNRLIKEMSNNAMTNSALISCINDTGATPKVSKSKFPYLAGILNLDAINQFSKYATHKFDILGKIIQRAIKSKWNAKKNNLSFFKNTSQKNPENNKSLFDNSRASNKKLS